MTYSIYEHKEATNFRQKHDNDKELLKRILLKYNEIKENPYDSQFKQLKSSKCPQCKRARVGNYRIIFFVSKKDIEIVSIISRKDNYKKY